MFDPQDDQQIDSTTLATASGGGSAQQDDGSAGQGDGVAQPPAYVPDPTPATDPKYKSIPQAQRKAENEIFYQLASIHPFCEFHEPTFIDLLEHSLSLPLSEKKDVIDAIPRLSQYQIDELVKVFVDEREEFKKIYKDDAQLIIGRAQDIQNEWTQLADMYRNQLALMQQQMGDQSEAERLKAQIMGG